MPELTSMREDSGERGFPSSQTTKFETRSITPADHDKFNNRPQVLCACELCRYARDRK